MATPTTPAEAADPQPGMQAVQLASSYMISAAMQAITQIGIPDLLKDGAKSTQELAAACGVNEDALYRVLRALAPVGVVTETAPHTFMLMPVGESLVANREGSMRDMVLWISNKFHFQIFPEMLHAIKTGETVVEKVFGQSCFDYLSTDKEVGGVFNAAMTGFSQMAAPALMEAYDFSWLNGKTLADVGGGHGLLLTSILKKYSHIHGMVFDLDHLATQTTKNIAEHGLAGRCQACGGNFFESVPAADAYILKHIIHDWSDEKAATILKNCHRAAKPGAKVILVELVLAPGNEANYAKLLDLEMLMLPGGRERTEQEFAQLFDSTGFTLARVVSTKAPISVLEAVKK